MFAFAWPRLAPAGPGFCTSISRSDLQWSLLNGTAPCPAEHCVKLAIGPAIENGFYYDVDLGEGRGISSEDFPEIEKKMPAPAKNKSRYERKEVSKTDAIASFQEKQDPYKLELLEGLEDGRITFYPRGGFTDLCRGPHIPDTRHHQGGQAHARGRRVLARRRRPPAADAGVRHHLPQSQGPHRVPRAPGRSQAPRPPQAGQGAEVFAFSKKAGAGLPPWLPKGTALRERLEQFLRHFGQVLDGRDAVEVRSRCGRGYLRPAASMAAESMAEA